MATTWGSAEGHLQAGINCWTSSPSASSTSVTVYLRAYVRVTDGWRFDDNQNYSISGTGGGSGSYYNGLDGTGATKLVFSKNFTASIGYGGGPTYSWTCNISGMYNGGTPSHSRSLTLPARPPGVPSTPGTPAVSGVGATSATLSWATPSSNGASLDRTSGQVSRNSTFTDIVASWDSGWATSRSVAGLPKGTTLYARVRAHNSVGWSPYSGTRTITTGTTVPSAPGTPVLEDATATGVTVRWAAPADDGGITLAEYTVQRATDALFSADLHAAALGATTLQVTGLAPGTEYWWRVRAANAVGDSEWSETASVTTPAVPPGAPPEPALTNVLATSMTVTYSAPADDGGSEIQSYEIQATDALFGASVTSPDTEPPYVVVGLSPATTYYVRVRAINAQGAGSWSPSASVTTLSGVRVGDGASWRDAVVWVGNGASWVLASVKTGNGSEWT